MSSTSLDSFVPSSFFYFFQISFSCLRFTIFKLLISSFSSLRQAYFFLISDSSSSRSSALNLFLVVFFCSALSSFWQFFCMIFAFSSYFSSCFSSFSSSIAGLLEFSCSLLIFFSRDSLNYLIQLVNLDSSALNLAIRSSCCSIFLISLVTQSYQPCIFLIKLQRYKIQSRLTLLIIYHFPITTEEDRFILFYICFGCVTLIVQFGIGQYRAQKWLNFLYVQYYYNLSSQMILKSISRLKQWFGAAYSKAMYQAWKNNPDHVHQDWTVVFNKDRGEAQGIGMTSPELQKQKSLVLSAYMLIRYYKTRGHQRAELDPLRLSNFKEFGKVLAKSNLDYDLQKNKIVNEKDLDQPFTLPNSPVFKTKVANFLAQKTQWTLREIQQRLQKIYSQKAGLEFMHISDADERFWLMSEFEKIPHESTSKEEKLYILQELTQSQSFNVFLNDKLKTSKRFGVQGLDAVISGLNKLVQQAVKSGVEYIGLGMAHRGRLNALANVFDKPLVKIFAEFQQNVDKQAWGNSGDVKYHLGTTTEKQVGGKTVRLSILPNPSHLEAVNPVLMGHVKAVKDSLKNEQKTLGVLIHGDGAVAGQGIVYECLQASYLNNYNVNGIIHIVANNQIGFTTTPAEARSGIYCTNVAKSIQAPIIHVNSDEPELVNKVISLAVAYRQKFKKDIFIDIIGYRRYGHNEQDQPAFTQPMMYQTISKKPPVYNIYSEKLIQEGIVTKDQVKQIWEKHYSNINQAYAQSLKSTFDITKWRTRSYHSVIDFTKLGKLSITGMSSDELKQIGEKVTHIPQGFNVHPNIKKIYDQRRKSIQQGAGIDFGTAQSLAFGSLLREGFNVRFSGQDVERGSFSHRHAVLVDQKTQQKYRPIHSLLPPEQKHRFQIQNSFLSEYACMGFQYGYALTNPNTLTVWEAQFGDFANGAQIIVDNYLTSGQSKWTTQNGLVLNLPHGMDGQGPQHSSGRMQRYLQLMNDSWVNLVKKGKLQIDQKALRHTNMSIICCSTAKNIFHSYRRQMRRDYRKPLLSFVNKKLLKLKQAGTTFQELSTDKFDTIIDDPNKSLEPKNVKKVILLYGQAYYSALQKKNSLNRQDVAFIRIQQIAPLHYERLMQILSRYPNATQFVWFQEQHQNSGAWSYVYPRISIILQVLKKEGKIQTDLLQCVSRRVSASTAVGKKSKHDKQQVDVLNKLFQK